jgi:hypothetical protein
VRSFGNLHCTCRWPLGAASGDTCMGCEITVLSNADSTDCPKFILRENKGFSNALSTDRGTDRGQRKRWDNVMCQHMCAQMSREIYVLGKMCAILLYSRFNYIVKWPFVQ